MNQQTPPLDRHQGGVDGLECGWERRVNRNLISSRSHHVYCLTPSASLKSQDGLTRHFGSSRSFGLSVLLPSASGGSSMAGQLGRARCCQLSAKQRAKTLDARWLSLQVTVWTTLVFRLESNWCWAFTMAEPMNADKDFCIAALKQDGKLFDMQRSP